MDTFRMASSFLERLLEQPDFCRKSRLPSLFSDFSPLALSNRDGYDANINAWTTALNNVLLDGGRLCIKADKDLVDSLASRQWGRPLALATVEYEARQKKIWIPVKQFLEQTDSIYHVSGLFERLSIGSVARWGLSKVWASRPAQHVSGTIYVCVASVEIVGEQVTHQLKLMSESGYSGYVTTTSLLTEALKISTELRLSSTDMQILLRYLERDKCLITRSSDVIKVIPCAKAEHQIVSETDIAIAHLKSTLSQLSSQISQLSTRLDSLNAQIRMSISKQQKSMALGAMKTRNLVDKQLIQRTDNLHTLEQILLKIDDAANNIGILKAMQGGSKALAEIMKQVGGIERVDQVLDQVQEQMAVNDEIGVAIAGASAAVVGEGEDNDENVEAEWKAMIERAAENEKFTVQVSQSCLPMQNMGRSELTKEQREERTEDLRLASPVREAVPAS